jgi:hypothetical protein
LKGIYLTEEGEFEEIINVNESEFNEDDVDPNKNLTKLAHPFIQKEIL